MLNQQISTSKIKKHDRLSITIEDLALGGRGIARAEGMTVFANRVVPGDEAEVQVLKVKKRYLEAKLQSITKPSPLRVHPRCEHFDICGGCTWQMLSYEDQLRFKEKQVFSTLEHIGGLKEFERRPILGCKFPWFYRNKMEFSIGWQPHDGASNNEKNSEKCYFGDDGVLEKTDFAIGLHKAGRIFDLFDLKSCHLGNPCNSEIVDAFRQFALKHHLQPFHFQKNNGLLRSLFLREGKSTGEIMLNLVISHEPFPQLNDFRDFMVNQCERIFHTMAKALKKKATRKKASGENELYPFQIPKLQSLYVTRILPQKGFKTQVAEILLHGEPTIRETLTVNNTTLHFQILPQAFFQTNTTQAEILYSHALSLAELSGNEVVYDLYSGTGTIGLFFAKHSKKVYGIEMNPDAVKNARESALLNGINNIEFFCGDVLGEIQRIADHHGRIERPDIVVVDPPRVGLHDKVIEHISALRVPKIIYVSCNPATLARDCQFFTQLGYKLKIVQPVDMFPHTYHIETVALLVHNPE